MEAFRFRHRDGGWRAVEALVRARGGPDGRAHVLVNSRDVTERNRQDRALRESKERLRTVIASAPLVLFSFDRNGTFTLAEGRGLDALGVRPAQLVGQSVFQLYADLPQALADVRRALGGEAFSSVVEVYGIVFEASYTPIRDRDGSVAGGDGGGAGITHGRQAGGGARRP